MPGSLPRLGKLFLELFEKGKQMAFLLANPAGDVWSGTRAIASSATAGGASPFCSILLLIWTGIGIVQIAVEVNTFLTILVGRCFFFQDICSNAGFFDRGNDDEGTSSSATTNGLAGSYALLVGVGWRGHVELEL